MTNDTDFYYSHPADRRDGGPYERNERKLVHPDLETRSIIWYGVNQELEQRQAEFRLGPAYGTEWAVLGFGAIQNKYDFVDPLSTGVYVQRKNIPEGQDTISLQDAWHRFYGIIGTLKERIEWAKEKNGPRKIKP